MGSQRQALLLVGLPRSTWHYRHHPRPRVMDPVPQAERAYPNRITAEAREQIEGLIRHGWKQQNSVDYMFASTWDQGILLASRRTWWRIAEQLPDQSGRPVVRTKSQQRQPRKKPVVVANEAGDAWSWDITELRSPWRGLTYKAYSIIDLASRELVGHRVENRESDDIAAAMFQDAIATHGAPKVVHADSGAAMVSNALYEELSKHDISISHSRPRVSNDNPFSESEFRTMKYRPNYPGRFDDLEHARAWVSDYVTWYNTQHRHSALALFTPRQVADGSWQQVWSVRDHALQTYYQQHPERFARPPRTPAPNTTVGINHRLPEPAK